MHNKGADQTARMHRLICIFVVRIWHKQFSRDVAQITIHHFSHMFHLFCSKHGGHLMYLELAVICDRLTKHVDVSFNKGK